MTYTNEINGNNSTSLAITEKSFSLIDLIKSLIRHLFGTSIAGNSHRANQAIAVNPKSDDTPKIADIKDKVWEIMTAPYTQNPNSWHSECQERVDASVKVIKKVVRNDRELERATWFIEDYLRTLKAFSAFGYDHFKKTVNPALSNYANLARV